LLPCIPFGKFGFITNIYKHSFEFEGLGGAWSGSIRLYVAWNPGKPRLESNGKAFASERIGGQFPKVANTSVLVIKRREGGIIIDDDETTNAVDVFRADSRLVAQLMICEGKEYADGGVSVNGSYTVEAYPGLAN